MAGVFAGKGVISKVVRVAALVVTLRANVVILLSLSD
jgi:hypothetical protein